MQNFLFFLQNFFFGPIILHFCPIHCQLSGERLKIAKRIIVQELKIWVPPPPMGGLLVAFCSSMKRGYLVFLKLNLKFAPGLFKKDIFLKKTLSAKLYM
jgi:hypothetical protein